jgi:hypothetical protein
MRIDDRVSSHQPSAGATIPISSGISMNQHIHRMTSIPQQQTQTQQYQQRLPRTGGPIQRG